MSFQSFLFLTKKDFLYWEHEFGFCYVKKAEKVMAPYSSTLAWKIPWMEEPGRLESVGLLRVRHDWAPSLSLFTFMHWRRKWQPTPVFLPGESQGQRSLVGCRLWGHTELDMTEWISRELIKNKEQSFVLLYHSSPKTKTFCWLVCSDRYSVF